MKRNYLEEEIEELIFDLSSDDEEVSDLAMSALLLANPHRHLFDIIDALEYSDDIAKQRICYILGGIVDERCVDPLLSILKDENIDTRIAAIDSLQYFPDERIIPHLKNQLRIDDPDIRKAVTSTLGIYVKNGVQDAHLPLIDVIKDETENLELRHLALKNIQYLEDDELKQTADLLKNVSDASIYSQILILEEDLNENKEQKIIRVEKLIEKLRLETDVLKQMKIEDQLVEYGGIAAKALMKKLFEEPQNTLLRVYSRMVFEKLGNKSISAFKSLFESFDQFEDIHLIVLLQDLITMVTRRQYISLTSSLLQLLNRLNTFIKANDEKGIRTKFIFIKSDIHLALAKYGSREAFDDLRQMMQDGTERKYISLIEAMQYIGDKDLLIPLINQYHAYQNSKRAKSIIKRTFRAIIKLEKIKRNDPIFKNLSETQKQNLKLIVKR